ncbi:MAG: hypothetical protein HUU23_16140 [Caldilineales bacterium]|nr:hypothetical protein [Caldilineales bacterium]
MRLIEQLAALQALDAQIDRCRQRYHEIQAALQPAETLQALALRRKGLQEHVAQWQQTQKQREQAVAAQTAKIQEQEKLLYGGMIKDAREQVNMQHNIEALQRQHAALEEDALAALLEVEQSSATLAEVEQVWQAEAAAWRRQQALLQGELQQVIQEARKFKAERDGAAPKIAAQALRQYESLRQQKNGVAVVKIDGASCGGCGSLLPTARRQQAYGDDLVTCPICGRLLATT